MGEAVSTVPNAALKGGRHRLLGISGSLRAQAYSTTVLQALTVAV